MGPRYRVRAEVVFDDGSTEPNPFMDWPYWTKFFGLRYVGIHNQGPSRKHTRFFLWDTKNQTEVTKNS